ncbi:uncharacterized protein LOC123291917 [Chrysoperla carnea]|uniref:uncharacterized protein LOC123291917 n=1 Tax=Chrysoperla carnea TaxID=189513 RepID=UPI001D07E08F|nr:uncharacterized protein LOC123291917 [Chrysoperla carnea]
MNFNRYRWCVASSCTNNSIKTPEKLFIKVPDDIKMRNVWLELAKRETLSTKSRLFLCEDHFNLEQDMKNYMEYKIMGTVKQVKMKANTIPSRFVFHTDEKYSLSPNTSKSTFTNTQSLDFVQGTENSELSEIDVKPRKKLKNTSVPSRNLQDIKADTKSNVNEERCQRNNKQSIKKMVNKLEEQCPTDAAKQQWFIDNSSASITEEEIFNNSSDINIKHEPLHENYEYVSTINYENNILENQLNTEFIIKDELLEESILGI